MRRIISLLVFVLFVAEAFAQTVSFVAKAPRVVAVGEQFQLKFEVSVMPEDFSEPNIKGFDVLAGPNMSQYSSTSIINGQVSRSSSITYTYILEGDKEGKFTVSGAAVEVNGKRYSASPITIEVVKSNDSQAAVGSRSETRESAGAARGDIFLKMEVSKTSLYRGEFVVATLKLYTRADIQGLGDPKFPSFNGFWNQVVEDNDLRLNFIREKYNGKIYETAIVRRYVLFPQQVGKLTIDPFQLTAGVVERSTPQSAFDAFFGGGATVARKRLSSLPIAINVKELPANAPKSFNGAIGTFTISSTLTKNNIRANDAANLVVKVVGTGNVKLLETPKVEFPADFETFEAKVSDNVKTTASGSSGTKTFEYSFIPRSAGKYTIPGIPFTYFDVTTNTYRTMTTSPQVIDVSPDPTGGAGNSLQGGINKEGIKLLNKDIHYISTGRTSLNPKGNYFLGTMGYFVILILIVVGTVASFLFLKKQENEKANVILSKNKRANKVARQRLKKAEILIKTGDTHGFYEEMLKALWGYLSDKLTIPIADLSKERATQLLESRGATKATIVELMTIVEECEFARYAPGAHVEEKSDRYNHAVEIISILEQLKK